VFDKLLDILVASWHRLCPLEICEAYNHGVVLRFGRVHRVMEPGLHWKWPIVEDVNWVITAVTTLPLPPQTLTTQDDVGVVVAAIIKYEVARPELFATVIWDQRDVLADVTMGAVRQAVSTLKYLDLIANPPEDRILELVRKAVNRYGFKVHAVTFTDVGRVRSLRLIQAQRAD
jgi:regulator of protease activity HflC (stomatin/prohibitin superfamily)